MLINKKNLLDALAVVKPGLANKEIIEQTTSFAFIKGRVVTYNDEISISHPLEGLELEGAVTADKLYALLGKIKKEEIEIDVEGSEIIISSGRIKAGLTLQSEIKLPLKEDVATKSKWRDLPEKFVKSVNFTMASCSNDMSRAVLTAVHVNKDGFIEASDSYRVARCDLGEEMPVKTFLLPASSAVEMVKFNPTSIAEGKGWIHFKTEEESIMSCRIFEDEYPDTSPHFKMKGTQIILPKTIEDVLDRAIIFAKKDHILDEMVTITLQDKRFKIRAESDTSWFEEEVNLHYDGEPITFHITPYLLKGILSETQACELSKDKLKFEGGDWVYISMLRYK